MGDMQWRTVALVGALSLALGWALGGGVASRPPGGQAGSQSRGPRALGVEQTRETAPLTRQLRLKLDRQPARPQPSRNPFVFGSRSPSAAPSGSSSTPAGVEPAVPVDDVPAPPPAPVFVLSGIATTAGADAPEFTAIISGGGNGLVFAKRGDELPGGYVVADVQATMVTLRDSSGGERTLRLR
jgi:hypothetical protein